MDPTKHAFVDSSGRVELPSTGATMTLRILVLAELIGLLGVAACRNTNSQEPTSARIGRDGGSVASADGQVIVSIPSGALDQDVVLTVVQSKTAFTGGLGAAYDVGPSGTSFNSAAQVTFPFSGDPQSAPAVETMIGGKQVPLLTMVDAAHHTVSGFTTHLSAFSRTVGESGLKSCTTSCKPDDCFARCCANVKGLFSSNPDNTCSCSGLAPSNWDLWECFNTGAGQCHGASWHDWTACTPCITNCIRTQSQGSSVNYASPEKCVFTTFGDSSAVQCVQGCIARGEDKPKVSCDSPVPVCQEGGVIVACGTMHVTLAGPGTVKGQRSVDRGDGILTCDFPAQVSASGGDIAHLTAAKVVLSSGATGGNPLDYLIYSGESFTSSFIMEHAARDATGQPAYPAFSGDFTLSYEVVSNHSQQVSTSLRVLCQ